MKKTVLVLNSAIIFSSIFSVLSMQIQSRFSDDQVFIDSFIALRKDFKWNDSGKINISPIQQLILDKNAEKQIEYAHYAPEKIPLLETQNTSNIGRSIPSLKSFCINHILQKNSPKEIIYRDMIEICREDILDKNDFADIAKILKKIDPYAAIRFIKHPQVSLEQKQKVIETLKLAPEEKLAHNLLFKNITQEALTLYNEKNIKGVENALLLGANPLEKFPSKEEPYLKCSILEKIISHMYSCPDSHTAKIESDTLSCVDYHKADDPHKYSDCNFHDSILTWTFKNYPYYTAYNLYKIFYKNYYIHYSDADRLGEKIIEIIKSHHLLQHTFEKIHYIGESESNIDRIQFAEPMEASEHTFKFFLAHNVCVDHIENSEKIKKYLIKNSTLKTLLSLKKQGITFNNPNLIESAAKSNNPLKLSFILHEQEKLNERPHIYFRQFLNNNLDHKKLLLRQENDFSENSLSQKYDLKLYKKILDARNGDMRPVEKMVLATHWPIYLEISKDIKKLNYLLNNNSSSLSFAYPGENYKKNKESFDSFDQAYSSIISKLKSHHIPPKIISYMLKDFCPDRLFSQKDFDFHKSELITMATYTYNVFCSLLSVLSIKSGVFPLILAGGGFAIGAILLGTDRDGRGITFSYKRRTRLQKYYHLQGFLEALATNNAENFQLPQKITDKKINSYNIIAKLFLRKEKSEYARCISATSLGLLFGQLLQIATFWSLYEIRVRAFLLAIGNCIIYNSLPDDFYHENKNYKSDIDQLKNCYIQQGMEDALKQCRRRKLQFNNLKNIFTHTNPEKQENKQDQLDIACEIYEKYKNKKINTEEL